MALEYESNMDKGKLLVEDLEYRILEAIGIHIDGNATELAPTGRYPSGKTGGHLKGKIRHFVDRNKKRTYVGTDVDYAVYVEKGTGIYAMDGNGRKDGWFYVDDMGNGHFTHGMRPRPFLTPAGEDVEGIKTVAKAVRFGNVIG